MVSISALTLVGTPLIVIHPIKALPSHSTVPICSPNIEHLVFTRTFLANRGAISQSRKRRNQNGVPAPSARMSYENALTAVRDHLGESLALELEVTRFASLSTACFSRRFQSPQ